MQDLNGERSRAVHSTRRKTKALSIAKARGSAKQNSKIAEGDQPNVQIVKTISDCRDLLILTSHRQHLGDVLLMDLRGNVVRLPRLVRPRSATPLLFAARCLQSSPRPRLAREHAAREHCPRKVLSIGMRKPPAWNKRVRRETAIALVSTQASRCWASKRSGMTREEVNGGAKRKRSKIESDESGRNFQCFSYLVVVARRLPRLVCARARRCQARRRDQRIPPGSTREESECCCRRSCN